MRKNDLIKILEGLEGNPEVVVWNGFVDDWQAINKEVNVLELVKHSKEYLERAINAERRHKQLPLISESELNQIAKEETWELPNIFVRQEHMQDWYGTKRKKIIVLSCKTRGKKMFDRLGSVEY